MPKVEDLTDRIFEKSKVIERTDNDKNGKACWVCQCECGNIVIVRGSDLKRKHTTSCGCRQKSIVSNIGLNNKKYNTYDLPGEYGIGYTPKCEEFYFDLDVDHIKHKTFDNRKSELRVIKRSYNCMNHKIRHDNKTGVSGIYYDENYNKYLVTIGVNNQSIYLGCFNDFNKALKVRKEAEEKYFGKNSYDNSMKGEING